MNGSLNIFLPTFKNEVFKTDTKGLGRVPVKSLLSCCRSDTSWGRGWDGTSSAL